MLEFQSKADYITLFLAKFEINFPLVEMSRTIIFHDFLNRLLAFNVLTIKFEN